MGYKRETARFHIETGPESLFERVRYKMKGHMADDTDAVEIVSDHICASRKKLSVRQ
jgi:hypothetical protein